MGLAVMLKKDPTLTVHAQDYMVNCRSQVLCVSYHGVKYVLANVYLHANGDVSGNQEVLDWLLPHFAMAHDAQTIVGGDFNANAGWAPGLSVASGPVCDQLTDFLSTADLYRCAPTPDVPIWVSGRGYSGALDHFLLPNFTGKGEGGAGVKVTAWTNRIFRSDHFPVSMDLPKLSAPLRISHTPKTRYRLTTTEPVHDRTRYNCMLRSRLVPAMSAPSTMARCQGVSFAITQSIRDVFGDPVECGGVPRLVTRQREVIERFVKQNPKWWTSATRVMHMHVRKRALQVSWDISSIENYLGVRPVGPTQNRPQPDKKVYRRVFYTKFSGEVEPAYTCPPHTAHHLAAAVALDQLAQRHLAPLSCISYPEV